jgi:chain length determinant protein EpsF
MPKSYKATTTMLINYRASDPVSGASLPVQLVPGYMATQVDIASSRTVALQVVDELRLVENPAIKEKFLEATGGKGNLREWIAEGLLKKMDATPARESSAINITFTDPDPEAAARIANAFGNAYQRMSIQLKIEPSRKAAIFFNDQIKELRDKFELAQKKLSGGQLKSGLSDSENGVDVETRRLNEISNQLVTVQAQLMDASSRKKQMSVTASSEAPDVVSNQMIQNLKAELSRAEARFAQIAERFTSSHPMYEQTQAEVNRLRANLKREIGVVSSSLGNNEHILQQRETDLRNALAAQKAKVLELNQRRDELKVLSNEMQSAQRAYETASQRFLQNNLEGQSNQSDIAVLTPAVAPTASASPKPIRNSVLSALLGIMLGSGMAFLMEMVDRRVRSPHDLVERLQAPVLGVMVSKTRHRSRFMIPAVRHSSFVSVASSPNQAGPNI